MSNSAVRNAGGWNDGGARLFLHTIALRLNISDDEKIFVFRHARRRFSQSASLAMLGHFLNLKISVITAVFNRADTVAEALASVHTRAGRRWNTS